jgi:hypothetical protein
MATAYIDVKKRVGINAIPIPTATSTTTNDVRVSWQTAISRHDVAATLREIADAIIDNDRFAQLANFTDT